MDHRAKRNQKIVEYLKTLADYRKIWGFSLALISEERVDTFYYGVMGSQPPYEGRNIEPGLYYDLASLSKVVGTTSRIMQLVEEGSLSFDMQVQSLLPEFQNRDIRVGHLLLHNSGLPAEIPDKQKLTRDNIIEKLYQVKPESSPGERFVYSDVGYILLGLIIKESLGLEGLKSLEESLKIHVFAPLEMYHTSYRTTGKEHLCVPTEVTKERGVICGKVHDRKAWLLGESGSAGLFSTLEDLVKFTQAYLRRDSRLFGGETFGQIFNTNVFGRTYGWSKEYGEHTLYHTGFTGTSILMELNRREGMVLLTNRIHPTRDNTGFLDNRKKINRMWLE